MSETQPLCHCRANVLVDVKVEADLSNMTWCGRRADVEEQAKELERAAEEFHDFLRDHRSQDMVRLDVQRVYQNQCSACGSEWEPDYTEKPHICASCGAIIEQEKPQ